jgi:hypothetical protein
MNQEMMFFVGLLLAGFFAVACIRASVPFAANGKLRFQDLLRFPNRLERLRRAAGSGFPWSRCFQPSACKRVCPRFWKALWPCSL